MNSKKQRIASLLLLVAILYGCAVKTPITATQPTPKTPLQWVIVYNAALAKANRSVEQSVEQAQKAGALTVNLARSVIITCGKIAVTSEAIRSITSTGTEANWSVDGPKIRAVISGAGINLPPSVSPLVDISLATVNATLVLLNQEVK